MNRKAENGRKEHKEGQGQKVTIEKFDIYLDQICGLVKAREVHNDLREELGNHLHEIICDKEQEGYSPDQAAAYAIEQMGDPTELGKSMHKLHRHRMHWGLLAGVIGLAQYRYFQLPSAASCLTDFVWA
ncbi:hypothetical protein HNR77_004948 [Paenibacillus sp. JGP012]|uniref:permease prefix domain 1-containing protein n=1 Tax=Paenibacillus sp. JGP012 TaxID=2735914 RepID=UPI00160FA066|nr:permease prefix domain 1-containing protein [Paenibacillus sp. JGP012]MBB6023846.1 hypothetical protein [Paenibacillus sp. JGP012]